MHVCFNVLDLLAFTYLLGNYICIGNGNLHAYDAMSLRYNKCSRVSSKRDVQ